MFIASCAGKFLALDKSTGKVAWSYDTKADGGPFSFHGDPLLVRDLVIIPADRGCGVEGYIYAFGRNTGGLRWKLAAGSPATAFARADNAVIVGTRRDEWLSVNTKTGKLNWKFTDAAPDPSCDIPKPAATDGTIVAFVSHDQVVHILNAKSGAELRKVALSSPASTAPFLYKHLLYIGTADGHLRTVDPASGKTRDYQKLPEILIGRFTTVKTGGKDHEFVLGTRINDEHKTGMMVAFADQFQHVTWERGAAGAWESEQPHLWKGWVIAGSCHGDIAAYRASDGALEWTEHVQGCIRSFGHDESTLYIGVQQGTVYAYRP